MPDVLTIGEILADFVPEGGSYKICPGGAPSNVAVNLRRWGLSSGIIARVGDDFIGDFLMAFLNKNRVNTSLVSKTEKGKTGLVFVFFNKYKDRDFSFYGEPSADKFLEERDIKEIAIKKCGILHFGSISMMAKQSGAATLKAVALAKKHGKLVSFDPNVRLNLWEGRQAQAKRGIRDCFQYADIIKLSDAELKFLYGAPPSGKLLRKIFGSRLVFVSAGEAGCYVHHGGFFRRVPGYKVKTVDTTGAGDAFMAGVLYGIIKNRKGLNINENELIKIAEFANKKGSEAVTHRGAV
jgi:sugar/nucleoside kinase (ribokinase family)